MRLSTIVNHSRVLYMRRHLHCLPWDSVYHNCDDRCQDVQFDCGYIPALLPEPLLPARQ
jgi:hypothetical protein